MKKRMGILSKRLFFCVLLSAGLFWGCDGSSSSSSTRSDGTLVTVPKVLDYYPHQGPAGSYVSLLFEAPVKEIAGDLQAYYKNLPISITGVEEDIIQVQIPYDATDGNIVVRAGKSSTKPVPFRIIRTETVPLLTETVYGSSNYQSIGIDDLVKVTFPPNFPGTTNGEVNLKISRVYNLPPSDINPFAEVLAFDVSLEGMSQLPEYIRISIPYDPADLNRAYPAMDQLAALRWNDQTHQWLALPFLVDEAAGEVHIYTDHLSFIGVVTLLGGVGIGSHIVTWIGEAILNDVYTTPNFRFLYSKSFLENSTNLSNSGWRINRPGIFQEPTYIENHPHSIQDIGRLHEMALDNYRRAGFKDPVAIQSQVWGEYRKPVVVKVDSWMAAEPLYEKLYQRIHLPSMTLVNYDPPGDSYAIIGHELFHRIQAEYYPFIRFRELPFGSHFWWIETTAEYAGNRAAWGGRSLNSHSSGIPADFLKYPIDQTGIPAHHWGEKRYEYASAVFIEFLVEHKGFDFREMVEYVASGGPYDEYLFLLGQHIRNKKTGHFENLEMYYQQFARWAVFSDASFLNQSPIASFTPSGKLDIAEKKDTLRLDRNDIIEVEIEGGDAWVNVFILPEGKRIQGNGYEEPFAVMKTAYWHDDYYVLIPNYSSDSVEIKDLKQNDVICFMGVNDQRNNQAITVTIKPTGNDDKKLSHTFNLAGNYSAKVWAVKVVDDVLLTITPDAVVNATPNQAYTFHLEALEIPGEVESVFFEWNFGDGWSGSKGKSNAVAVDAETGRAHLEISHTYQSDNDCYITAEVKDGRTGEKLAGAVASVSFAQQTSHRTFNISFKDPTKEYTIHMEFEIPTAWVDRVWVEVVPEPAAYGTREIVKIFLNGMPTHSHWGVSIPVRIRVEHPVADTLGWTLYANNYITDPTIRRFITHATDEPISLAGSNYYWLSLLRSAGGSNFGSQVIFRLYGTQP